MADPRREQSSLQEELMTAGEDRDQVVCDLPPSLGSRKERLSEEPNTGEDIDLDSPSLSPMKPSSDPNLHEEQAPGASRSSPYAELTAALDPPGSEWVILSVGTDVKTALVGQQNGTPPASEAAEATPKTSEEHCRGEPSPETGRERTAATPNSTAQNVAPSVTAGVESCAADISAAMLTGSCPLGQRVQKIQRALTAATKHSHCCSCLHDKRNQAPDLLCVDCALSFCFRCSGRHKSTPSSSAHTMLPVSTEEEEEEEGGLGKEDSETAVSRKPRNLSCPVHGRDAELSHFCRNCEVLACGQCMEQLHQQCPGKGKLPLQEYAREEREGIKRCRVKYAQVMRFFSEQRRHTEERLAALSLKKQTVQGEVRKFFSVLIKSCMDVEGSLLEELETTVSDHVDGLLGEQGSAWRTLQDSTQQLLDITDVLHFLPTADFLPLMEASKTSLSQALREGESLAAAAPPEMSIELCLAQSSLRNVVKRIKEIGATALTITTHKTLTLRKVSGMSFSTADDKTDPLVTAMTLLTPSLLLAADFNNSCLKRFQREELEGSTAAAGDGWNCTEVLPLKWRPYGMTKLFEEHCQVSTVSSDTFRKPDHGAEMQQHQDPCPTAPYHEHTTTTTGANLLAEAGTPSVANGKQTLAGPDGGKQESAADSVMETEIEIHVAVTSPFAGCFEVVVPVAASSSGSWKMRVVRAIDEEKGFWGLGVVGEHKLALSTIASGRSYMSLVDTLQTSTAAAAAAVQRLPLACDTTLTPLVSPRHVLPTSSASFLVGDHGRRAVIHASVDGKVLFTFTGSTTGSQSRGFRPEGLCLDSVQGYVYVADSADHSILVLSKGGHLYSKTGSQQSDLHCPQALCMDRNSRLYVANESGKLLAVYEVFQES